jgi:metal-responsive CopG/Arc/MetJ family transcriptional regulator
MSRRGSKIQITVWMSEPFVKLIDEFAGLTGSTRSDFLRRAAERYIQELKQSNIIKDIKENMNMLNLPRSKQTNNMVEKGLGPTCLR